MDTRSRFLYLFIGFCCGVGVAVLAPILGHALGERILPEGRVEAKRVTSPDGLVDAVLVISGCGPLCSDTYSVSVVPKGEHSSDEPARNVFLADDVDGQSLGWKEPHLLEIKYDRALIYGFRNLSYPFAKEGVLRSWDYKVETRLEPTSPNFSYLRKAK